MMMKKKGFGKTLAKLYKSYLFTVVAKDLKKLADVDYRKQFKRAVQHIDIDKRYWLHKMGLTTYNPVKSTMGSGFMFLLGAGIGAVAGMALTPMKGDEFRKELKGKATQMMAREDLGQTQAPAEA